MVEKSNPKRHIKKYRINAKSRQYVTQNLAIMLKASVPIGEVLQSFSTTTKSRSLKDAIKQAQKLIDEGYSLSNAFRASGIVSSQTLALIEIGEQSGTLVQSLQVASVQEEKQRKLRSKVRSALIYPSFVLSLTGIVGIGVAWFLLPRLSDTFTRLSSDLPPISKIMLGVGVFLEANGVWFVPSLIILIVAVVYLLFFAPKLNRIGKTIIAITPGISRLIKEVEIARFGYLLGSLLQSGLSIVESLKLLEKATSSPRHHKFYGYLRQGFDNGLSFKVSLENNKVSSRLLPPEVQQIIMAAERSGSLPETLLEIGDNYEERVDVTAQNLQALMEPVLLIIVWLGVLLVAISIILPIYQLVGSLNA